MSGGSIEIWLRERKEHFVVAGIALLLVSICFLLEPSLFSSADFLLFYKQNFIFLEQAIKEWRLPSWNPAIGLGRPFLADIQNGVFYPLTYVVLLGPEVGALLLLSFHAYWLACGMKRFGAAIGIEPPVGYALGFAFFFSGVCASRVHAGQIMFVCGMSYIPWLFYFATRLDNASARTIGQYAGLVALQFLTGHPQVFWLTGIGTGVFVVARSLQRPIVASLLTVTKNCLRYGLANAWGLLITAVVLLPFFELVHYGNRTAPTLEFVSLGVMDDWLKFFGLFGEPPQDYFIEPEQNLFLGFGILVPGVMGLTQLKNRDVRGLLAVCLLAFLIMVGNRTPVFNVFYHWLPGFKSFRLHSRAGMLMTMAIVSAAGIWLSYSQRQKYAYAMLTVIGAVLLFLVLKFYPYHLSGGSVISATPLLMRWGVAIAASVLIAAGLRPRGRGVVILVLLVAVIWELGSSTWFYKRVYTFENMMKFSAAFPLRPAILKQLSRSVQPQSPPMPPRALVPWKFMPQNDAMVYHFSHCDAYTSLFLDRPWRYLHDFRNIPRPSTNNTFLSGAVYKQGVGAYPHLAADLERDISGDLVLNTNPMPRAFLVFAATNVSNADQAIASLRNGWDIYRIALTETRLNLPQISAELPKPVQVRSFTPNEILMETSCDRDALLVLAEAWYPGWKASAGGKVVDSIVANGWMRAFPISAGTKEVKVYYRQTYLLLGLLITLAALAGLIYVWRKGGPSKLNTQQ